MAASSKGSTPEHSFRVLCHRIANELTPQNCSSLQLLFNIHIQSTDQEHSGMDIMTKLLSQDHLNHLRPESLETAMSEINRPDLVNLVRKYKKNNESKPSQKSKPIGRKWRRKQTPTEEKNTSTQVVKGDTCSWHTFSLVLMHTAQNVGQARYFMEAMMTNSKLQPKKEAALAVSDVKKDFDSLTKSLNRAISAITELQSAGSPKVAYELPKVLQPMMMTSDPNPRPLPNPGNKSDLTRSSTHPNLTSLGRSLALSTIQVNTGNGRPLSTQSKSASNRFEPPDTAPPPPVQYLPKPRNNSTSDDIDDYNEIPLSASQPTQCRIISGSGLTWRPKFQHTEDKFCYETPKVVEEENHYKTLSAHTKDDEHLYCNI